MGIRVELSPHLLNLMNDKDREWVERECKFQGKPMPRNYDESTAKDPKLQIHPEPKQDIPERKQQADFANWLLLQNSNGRDIPFCWHATHTRSKASPGTPDFWVGINRHSMWIEFKKDYSQELSPEQEEFRRKCEVQCCEWHIAYSCAEAIKIVYEADKLTF